MLQSTKQKAILFDVEITYVETIECHMPRQEDAVSMKVTKKVVHLLKAYLLPSMTGIDAHIAPFLKMVNESKYLVVVKKGTVFNLVMREVDSSRSCSEVVDTITNFRTTC